MIKIRRLFVKNEEGAALIESAITLPILILIISGIFEFCNYSLINNKLVRATGVLGDMVSRQNLTRANLIALMQTVDVIMMPYNKNQQIGVVVSHISNKGATADKTKMTITWQQKVNGANSNFGAAGSFPQNLPDKIEVLRDQAIIVTEVFFNYTPIVFQGFYGTTTLYKTSVYVPRVGNMTTLLGGG